MTKYILTMENGKDVLAQVDKHLSELEVKGNSVEHLYIARRLVVQLHASLAEVQEGADDNKLQSN